MPPLPRLKRPQLTSKNTLRTRHLLQPLERRILLAAQPYTWSNAPIHGGGFVDGIVFSPAQQNLVYARTDVGGGYRWNNTTSSWIALNDALTQNDSQLLGVLSLAPDPSNANNVYEAVGQYTPSWAENAAILYSTNQGATWGRTNLPFKLGGNEDGRGTGERLQVDPNKGVILFLGTNNNGLWKSTDSGHTWNQLSTFPNATATSLTFVLFDKSSATASNATQTIYVGVNTTTGPNLYRSTNGGTTWAAIPNEPTGMIAFKASLDTAGSLYVTYTNNLGPNNVTTGAVYRLATTTNTWTALTLPSGQGGFAGVSVDPAHAGTLVVTTIDRWYPHDQIYRSTDSGAAWTSLWASNTTFDDSTAPWASSITPHWLDAVAIDPFNTAHAMFGTGFGLFSSANINATGTVKWSFTDNGLEETVPQSIIAPPTGAPLGVAVGDVDGFRFTSTTTVGARFSPNQGTNNDLEFAQLNPSKWVRTYSGGGAYSTDDGITWTSFATTPPTISNGAGDIAISADGSALVWMPTNSAAYYSTNNGATWTLSAGSPSSSTASYKPVADSSNPNDFYIYNDSAQALYFSSNGGVSFASTASITSGSPPSAVPEIAGDLWDPASGGLYHSVNFGASFTKMPTVQAAYQIGFGKAPFGKTYPALYLLGTIAGVLGFYRSDNAGASWTQINDANHNFGWIDQIIGDPNVYGRVYISTGGRGVVIGNVVNTAPTIATALSAPANPVTTTSTSLSVLGADDNGESNLTYTWSATGPASVAFSTNNTNAAKNTNATFSHAGTYSFTVTITDFSGASITSNLSLSVSQTATSLTVTPGAVSLYAGASQQFTATVLDQFQTPLATQPPITWTLTSGTGTLSSTGLYTAPLQSTNATVQASTASLSQSAAIATASALPGDANLDGAVDLSDLSITLNNFGTATPNWTDGNFDGAATINLTDLSDVLNNFGQTNASASSQLQITNAQLPTTPTASNILVTPHPLPHHHAKRKPAPAPKPPLLHHH